jgi:cytochrome c-type biogenesis protein CcmH/NrfG
MKRLARMIGSAAGVACLVASLAAPCMAATPAAAKPDVERCRAVDACYDAIRRNPSDPSLLSALGDALVRANRPADALRTYQRVVSLAPNTPGVAAKISAIEAKSSAKRPSANPAARTVVADTASGKRYSNAAPETQSH